MDSEFFPILVRNICEKTCVATSQEKEMFSSIIKNNISQEINKIYVTRYRTFFILVLPIIDVYIKHSWMIFRIVIINEGKDSKLKFRFVSQEKDLSSLYYSGKEFKFKVPANTTIYSDVKIKLKKTKGKIFIGVGEKKNYKKLVVPYKKIKKPITLEELKQSHFLGLTEKCYVDSTAILSIIYTLKKSKKLLILGKIGISQETISSPPKDIMDAIYEQRKEIMIKKQNELQGLIKPTSIAHTMDAFKPLLTLKKIKMDHMILKFFLYPNIYPIAFITDFKLYGYVNNTSYSPRKVRIKVSSSSLVRTSISTTIKVLPKQVIPFSFSMEQVFGKRENISLNVNYEVIVKIKKIPLNLFRSILSWFRSILSWFTTFLSWVFFHLFLFLLLGTCYCFLSDLGCFDSMENRLWPHSKSIRRPTGNKYKILLPIEISDSIICPYCREFTSDFDQEKQIWFCSRCNSYVSSDIEKVEQSIKYL